MKIWLLLPQPTALDQWRPWYDKVHGIVVAAQTEEAARRVASFEARDEGPSVWFSAEYTSCREIVPEALKQDKVILANFHPA